MTPRRLAVGWCSALAAALAVISAAGGPALSAEGARVVVLDASRSMRSTVDGKSKAQHARELLSEIGGQQVAGRAPGLVVFGGRDGNSCSDIQTAVQPGGDGAAFRSALAGVEQKGTAPVGDALKAAFEAALSSGKPVSLVLVADSSDTCNVNVCAMAKSLKERAPTLQIHAIGFVSSDPSKVRPLACLAEVTGGRFTVARGRADLSQALSLALGGPPPAPADALAAKAPEAPTGVIAPSAAPSRGDQAANPLRPESPSPTAFRADPLARLEPIVRDTDRPGSAGLPPGEEAPVPPREIPVLAKGIPRATLSLADPNAAPAAQVPVAAATCGTPKIEDVLGRAGAFGSGAVAASASGARGLPRAAGSTIVPVALASALAEHTPMLRRGVTWRVFRAERDGTGAYPLVAESSDPAPMLSLEPGGYIVHGAYGRAQVTKRICVGRRPIYERLVFNAGGLRLAAVVGQDGKIPDGLVSFAIYRGDPAAAGQNTLVVPAASAGRVLQLTEGTYHVVSRYGDGNAVVRANVKVEAGRLTDATMYHKAGRVVLKLAGEPGGEAIANTSWSVKTPDGEVVRESSGAFPSHILAAGDYAVVAHHDGRNYTRKFRVEPGPDREIEVIARN